MESIYLLLQSPAFIAFATGLGLKGIEKGGEMISEGALNWFTDLFVKNGKPKSHFQKYIEAPKHLEHQNALRVIIENSIDDDPESEKFLKEFYIAFSNSKTEVKKSKNINFGNVSTNGGNFRLGDNYGE